MIPGGDAGNLVEAGDLTDEIDDQLNHVNEGHETAVHEAVAAFETALSEAVDEGG